MGREKLTDIHCHGLYGVDDGAQSFEDSVEMLKAAWEEDIGRIINTVRDYFDGKKWNDIF